MSSEDFQYEALDRKGGKTRGRVRAASLQDAVVRLRADGLTPIEVGAASQDMSSIGLRRGPSSRSLAEWLRAIGMLLGAGAPLVSALAMVRQQANTLSLTRLTETFEREVAGGQGVAVAIAATLQGRSAFVAGLVAAGEASGDLAGAFERAAVQIEKDARIVDAFWSALSYPVFILLASIAAILVILLLVTPSIAPLLAQDGGQAPLPLAILIATSNFLAAYGGAIVTILVAAMALVLVAGAAGILRRPTEALLLDGPFARLTAGLVFGRFASVLGHLLATGVPTPEAFRLASSGVAMGIARQRLDEVTAKLFEGIAVAAALDACGGMPSTIVRMARVGEETGALGMMIAKAGDLEQDGAITTLKRTAAVLGPAMIVLLGGLVGLVMGGLLSGMASLGETMLR
ncbi:type II secretion system F family protein [Phenylobacterium sp.]|uniref:type II secretion system F family protein n=1 Tax=Phenylobacterium sp. TaxID=1871053 RepID=UPI002FCC1747